MIKKSEVEKLSDQLHKFIPEEACIPVANIIVNDNIKLTITKNRKTKGKTARSGLP